MGIEVCGISFHVGSGATNPDAFSEAIALARTAFDAGTGIARTAVLFFSSRRLSGPGLAAEFPG